MPTTRDLPVCIVRDLLPVPTNKDVVLVADVLGAETALAALAAESLALVAADVALVAAFVALVAAFVALVAAFVALVAADNLSIFTSLATVFACPAHVFSSIINMGKADIMASALGTYVSGVSVERFGASGSVVIT